MLQNFFLRNLRHYDSNWGYANCVVIKLEKVYYNDNKCNRYKLECLTLVNFSG